MEILEYKLKGYCCSQIIVEECLKNMGKENDDFVKASGGFCFGLGVGANCGIVTAAIAMLHLDNPQKATEETGPYFIDWFKETFGSIECEELLEGNPINKVEKCPMMIEASLTMINDLTE